MKNITQFFDQKIVNELYNEISQPTAGLKHDNILLKIANFFWPPSCMFFSPLASRETVISLFLAISLTNSGRVRQ